MSLYRQLLIIIFVLFMLMFIGTFTISINNIRAYLVNQLASHAQDTATSLGLSISHAMGTDDFMTIETMVNAIFDRGYYREIIIANEDDQRLISRTSPLLIEEIPSWFIALIPLETPQGESLVMSGWRQSGVVYVTSHPGYAYATIWRSTIHMLLWYSAAAGISLVIGMLLLRTVLSPLRAVERQAEAICAGQYPVQKTLPWTRELRHVVQVMNNMSLRVKQMFKEQSALTERLYKQVYIDPLTELGNQRYFDNQLGHMIGSPEEFSSIALFLLELQGPLTSDDMLRQSARILRECHGQEWGQEEGQEGDECRAAHLAEPAVFALLVSKIDNLRADLLAARIIGDLKSLHSAGYSDAVKERQGIVNIGIAFHLPEQGIRELLNQADYALRTAQNTGINNWHSIAPDATSKRVRDKVDHSAIDAGIWGRHISEVIASQGALLYFQTIVTASEQHTDPLQDPLHLEILLRIPDPNGTIVEAGAFMPMVAQLKMAPALDRVVIQSVMRHMSAGSDSVTYVVNIHPNTIRNSETVEWIRGQLREAPELARRLVLESTENGVLSNVALVRDFIALIKPLGGRFAIDHFGQSFTSFDYLRTLELHHIKIDGSFIRGIDQNKDNQFLVQALAKMGHELKIQVIAKGIETEDERDTVKTLHVDGMQGYLFGEARPL